VGLESKNETRNGSTRGAAGFSSKGGIKGVGGDSKPKAWLHLPEPKSADGQFGVGNTTKSRPAIPSTSVRKEGSGCEEREL